MNERQKSDLREKTIARQEGGKRVPGSGSSAELKGDIKYAGVLQQDKRSAAKSMSVKLADLYAIEYQAMNRGKLPVFSFGFDGTAQEWIAFPRWWIRNQSWWEELKSK